jgi:patatin-like phospholipase/acyl hydrolase
MKPILILSIDGGGLRGVVPLTILKKVQQQINSGREIWELFDLVAGTSTGGLITSALTLRSGDPAKKRAQHSIDDILTIYKEKGHIIFPQRNALEKAWHAGADLVSPKFSEDGLHRVLTDMLGNHTITDCLTNILISTYDLHSNRPLFFKSIDNKYDNQLNPKLYDICRATSAGPTYLPAYRFNYAKNTDKADDPDKLARYCVDGGIFVNNPSMAALSDMMKNRKYYAPTAAENDDEFFKNIFVLSIGTGTYSEDFTWNECHSRGLVWWAENISELMMRGVNLTTHYQMEQMMEEGHYLRLTIDIKQEEYAEMSDSSSDTTQYLIKETESQVLHNPKLMHDLDKWIEKAGLKSKFVPSSPADLSKDVNYQLGSLKDLVAKIKKPGE